MFFAQIVGFNRFTFFIFFFHIQSIININQSTYENESMGNEFKLMKLVKHLPLRWQLLTLSSRKLVSQFVINNKIDSFGYIIKWRILFHPWYFVLFNNITDCVIHKAYLEVFTNSRANLEIKMKTCYKLWKQWQSRVNIN